MDIKIILKELVEKNASDVFIVAGRPLSYKQDGVIRTYAEEVLMPQTTRELIQQIYESANNRSTEQLVKYGDDDFSFAVKNVSRFRVSAYKQRGSLAAVIRVITFSLPDPEALNIPENVLKQVDRDKGLVLVTGVSGSGKSTTVACMIDRINSRRSSHIVTLEDPIEYLHPHKQSIVSQREISLDTQTYLIGLRAVLRQTPNVIFIGELRDAETISIAMTAAETGHLVISTLHTAGAANTVDRIIDAFPAEKQEQIRLQLSMVLSAVVSQQFVTTLDRKIYPAFEIMVCNSAVRNMIREAKTHQLDSTILSASSEGMMTMDNALMQLYQAGRIDAQMAIGKSFNPELMEKRLEMKK